MNRLLLASVILAPAWAADCVVGDFTLETKGKCSTYATLLASFKLFFADKVNVAHTGCTNSADIELLRLLGVLTVADAESAIKASCAAAIEAYDSVPFADIAGYGEEFDNLYFRGASDWNEEVATLYPPDPKGSAQDPESNFLKRDAVQILNFYNSKGLYGMVDPPENLSYLDLSQCQMNAVYCCWAKDRQANDNNGNCARPYDVACVDSNPGDNTDLCYVEPTTNGAFLTFPGDDGNSPPYKAEGPAHCHGFGWADDDAEDPSVVFRGNNLFYISMYDHLYQRGYVRNIEGAPMCGCAEVMPVVTRADCTQMAVSQNYTWTYDAEQNTLLPALTDISIQYNQCTGIDQLGNQDNNDLWPHLNRLFIEGRVPRSKVKALSRKLVGENRCPDAEKRMFGTKGLYRGYNNKASEWTLLGARDSLGNSTYIGKEGAKYLMGTSTPFILRRLCASCLATHQFLYYKRLTPIPDVLNLMGHLMFETSHTYGNTYQSDFLIFSTYEDAKDPSNSKAWKFPAYDYSRGFPGNCGPGNTAVTGQESIFGQSWTKTDAAWHVETSERVLTPITTTLIGNNALPGSSFIANNNIYLTASGSDIWDKADGFMFYNAPYSGSNVTLITKLKSLDHRNDWTKAGLMIRESTSPGAKGFAMLVTGTRGVVIQWRTATNATTSGSGHSWSTLRGIWMKLTKVGNVYTGYQSSDGVTWTIVDKPQTVMMGDTDLQTGLALTSHDNRLSEAVFTDYSIA